MEGNDWDWEEYATDVSIGVVSTAVSSKLRVSKPIPTFLRDIKDEAVELEIKGTRKLTKYLNAKQTYILILNGFNEATVDNILFR